METFLQFVELLARYDKVLKDLIDRPDKSLKYLSPQIQNQLIDMLAQRINIDIIDEIKSARIFSVIFDTIQDISKVDQLSQVIRYVTIKRDNHGTATGIEIHESFVGFSEVSGGTANDIISVVESKGLQMSNCRGQGYDRVANMSGIYSGVQARISAIEPTAKYVHCAAHNTNLVLNDSVKSIQEVSSFYDTLQSVYIFFRHSIRRWDLLKKNDGIWREDTQTPLSYTMVISRGSSGCLALPLH